MNIHNLRRRLAARFDLRSDQAGNADIDQTIRDGVVVKGTNLWVLIFAIFIASIGLNVNSAAVIIGAMLISPLMGPIMGIGYGAGINDSALLRKALFNLGLTALTSLLTSALYFLISPLTQAQSELLARTTPTLWDVLIALFGGLAGMIGVTRKQHSNLVPGVAIATALMPPLCTAGYGLATRQFEFMFGALYLFTINSVFIAYATLLMTRVMRLPMHEPIPGESLFKRRLITGIVVLLMVAPSLYLAVDMVQNAYFQSAANRYVKTELRSRQDILVVNHETDPHAKLIQVTVVGQHLDDATLQHMQERLALYGLQDGSLKVIQSHDANQAVAHQNLLRDFLGVSQQELTQRDAEIHRLRAEVQRLQQREQENPDTTALLRELKAQFPQASDVVVAQGLRQQQNATTPAPVLMATVTLPQPLSSAEHARLQAGLSARFAPRAVVLNIDTATSHRKAASRNR